ncbi:MAG: DUF5667 domain-containing protein [Anaerolineales bacterium]|jgi:hypothetical protein
MNEKFYEALEDCLQALETGADIESVLKRYPQMADELRPILETSVQAQSLAVSSVPEDAARRGRARVLGHAAGMSAPVRRSRRSIFSFPRLAASLALALIFILSGTGLVRASNGALPGDNLYPVKRTWEDMRLLLAINPTGREELEDEFEQERLYEVDELLGEGRHETIKFAGIVTEQNGDQWLVAGIPVQITPDSQLPAEPISAGASVMVEGNTNAQGFVEAHRIEIVEPGITLPPVEPSEAEGLEDATQEENPVIEGSDQNEAEKETLSGDDQNSGGKDDGEGDTKIDTLSESGGDDISSKDSGGGDHSDGDSSSSSGESGDD